MTKHTLSAIRISLLSLMILAVFTTVSAQGSEVISPRLCQIELVDGAAEACAALVTCMEGDHWETCYPQLFEDMLSPCSQPVCETDRLLNLALFVAGADYDLERLDMDVFLENLIDSVYLYRTQEDYPSAADNLLALYETYHHRHLAYAAGLIYERAGMFDEALASYSTAERTQFFTPLVFYSRGYLYTALDDAEHANRDFYTFTILRDGESYLDMLSIPEGMESYTPPESATWTLFPLASYASSPGGNADSYLFDAPPRDVTLAWLDDGQTLAVQNDGNGKVWGWSRPGVLFFRCEDQFCDRGLGFQSTYPGLSIGGTYITIAFDGDSAEVIQYDESDESGQNTYWVMLPAPADDPRPAIPCENGVYPRLQVGDTVYPEPDWLPLALYAEPSTESAIVAEAQRTSLSVVGDLTCGTEGNWWQLSLSDGTTGWAQEAENGVYRLMTYNWPYRLTIDELLELP